MKDIFKDIIDSSVNETISDALKNTASDTQNKLNSTRDIINEIINSTVAEYKKQYSEKSKYENSSFTEKTYTDEPILFVASKMKSYTPPKISEMRKLERGASWSAMSDSGIFYKQAKFMEDYEDDYDFNGEFIRYYPTYRSMSVSELRGYFSWRTKVRKGKLTKTSFSFAMVYIYELLNLIGAKNPEEAYLKLRDFFDAYSKLDEKILQYKKNWLNDFVVYYNLPKDFYIFSESERADYDKALEVLNSFEEKSDKEIFLALNEFSSYNIIASPFYKAEPKAVEAVTAKVYRKLSEYHKKHRKTSLNEKLFGKSFKGGYFMFNAAVFNEQKKHEDSEYEVNNILKFICKNGIWYQERTFEVKGKSSEIREILKNIDCLMREKYNFKHKLTRVESTKIIFEIINCSIDEYLKVEAIEKKQKEINKIDIDLSKLQSIRDTSLVTQNKLIVEEEFDEEIIIENNKKEEIKEEVIIKETIPQNNTALNNDEFLFLVKLIKNEGYKEFIKTKNIMLSIMIDSVNEKLYDVFGDTVIDFDGETPIIIEDYLEELKGEMNL